MLSVSTGALNSTRIISDNDDELFTHTKLSPLDSNRKLDQIAFSRSRIVTIDWGTLIIKSGGTPKDAPYIAGEEEVGAEHLRVDLESRWGLTSGVTDVGQLAVVNRYVLSTDPPFIYFGVAGSQRRYMVEIEKNNEYQLNTIPPWFVDIDEYKKFWKHVIRVRSPQNDPTVLETVDLAPAIIYRQYRELVGLKKLGDALAANSEKLASREFGDFPSASDLADTVDGYLRMRTVQTDVEIKLERLRDKAKDLGYHLALTDETIPLPDGSSDQLQAGQIYQPYLTQYAWQTTEYRRYLVSSNSFIFSTSWIVNVPYYEQHVRSTLRYKKIIPDFDPWIEKERELSEAGFTVFRFERRGEEYVTREGDSIEEIAERCEIDTTFCARCAVLIPVYEQGLVSGEILTKYIVIKRPRRGTQVLHLPKLYIEEDLVVSTHFRGVEVGELVESINLAPGEEREISIEKTSLSEREERRTATSISDLTESDRIDLSTEMEKESSRSSEQTSTQSLSAKAGGSMGAFSGSAEGSTSSTQTTKQFARDLQKIANKASRSVTKQTRQEVKTESSTKSTVSSRTSTKITLRNINDGRSLNLLFYQLYNIYGMSLSLERMRFTLLGGREIIAGSGIVLPEVYSLHRLEKLLERMDLSGFPIRPNGVTAETSREIYQKGLVASIIGTIKEYTSSDGGPPLIDFDDKNLPFPSEPAKNHVSDLIARLNKLAYTGNSVVGDSDDTELVIGSPGLYLDANVGARPGTEPYSESMRSVELQRRVAEVQEVIARATYSESMAHRLSYLDPGYRVIGEALTLRALKLSFSKEPSVGDWALYLEGTFVTDFHVVAGSGTTVEINFKEDQAWLQSEPVELARIIHKTLKTELTFLI